MAPKHAHERGTVARTPPRKNRAQNRCDIHASSADGDRVTQIAVSPEQLAIVTAAREWKRRRGACPTASALARAVEMTEPETWRALKSLDRLGVVKWDRGVKVLRHPDGIVFEPKAASSSTLYFPAVGA